MAYQTTAEQAIRRRHGGPLRASDPESQAFAILYLGYVVLPLIVGFDKFFHYLVDWNRYLAPFFADLVGGRVGAFMSAVGLVEIFAGLLVAARPRIGSLVVAAWLGGIIVNLLLIPGYFDIALRDFGLCLGALTLSRLSADIGR